ncbi:hypothetical protein [Bacillus cereus]|nr:hypothetical protein [Bacillus cereus]PFA01936.1 hypothetical protein CN377_27215 [Bacillus cereus]PFS75542.1 hypothetical protein COK49_18185 [Bacillus cereus]PGS11138.1 hypothetical protein COC51_23205 [Bacillus cereus]PGV21074.1 hypothetical protein COD93_31930 [Bacillus cereus]
MLQGEQPHDSDVLLGEAYDLYDQIDRPFYGLFFLLLVLTGICEGKLENQILNYSNLKGAE